MVKVWVKRKDAYIDEIEIKDHSGYAKSGQDLVCAGVSSIGIGMLNALDQLVPDMCELQIDEAYIKIKTKQSDEVVQLLLKAMLIQLSTMQESYQTYITINDQEV